MPFSVCKSPTSPWRRCLTRTLLVCGFAVLTGCPYDEKLGFIDYNTPKEYTTTASGLKYRIVRQSSGPKPMPEDIVRVHYRGWLDDGTIFDDSYKRGASEFQLSGVVPGFREGVQLVGKEGKIELVIPPELGYGESGSAAVPPNSTLHFVIELLQIKKVGEGAL